MITASHFRTKTNIAVIYLVLFTFLGVYSLFTKADTVSISNSMKDTGYSQTIVGTTLRNH